MMFFEAEQSATVVSVVAGNDGADTVKGRTVGDFGTTNSFLVCRTGASDADLTVYYQLGGSATNGVDYTNLSGAVTIPAGYTNAEVVLQPVGTAETNFDVSVLLTLVPANSYLLDPANLSARLWIDQYTTPDIFTLAAEEYQLFPVGIDYHAPTASLVAAVSYIDETPYNFARVYAGAGVIVTNWSSLQDGAFTRIATVKTTTKWIHVGETYFNNGAGGASAGCPPTAAVGTRTGSRCPMRQSRSAVFMWTRPEALATV